MKKLFSLAIVSIVLICACGFGEKPRVEVKDFADLKAKVNAQGQTIAGQKAKLDAQEAKIAEQKKDLQSANEMVDQLGTVIDDAMTEAVEARDLADNHELIIQEVRGALGKGE